MIGWTLGRYFAARFLILILAVFLTICGMVFVVDFVELLRRASDIGGVPTRHGRAAGVPARAIRLRAIDAVLRPLRRDGGVSRPDAEAGASGGARGRRLGLGFLVPPIAIGLIIGVGAVTLFNPSRP